MYEVIAIRYVSGMCQPLVACICEVIMLATCERGQTLVCQLAAVFQIELMQGLLMRQGPQSSIRNL